MKKILLLGGPVFQKPVIQRAKSMGLYVGVADISKDAPAASLADEFFQGSIRDYEAMLAIAREFKRMPLPAEHAIPRLSLLLVFARS